MREKPWESFQKSTIDIEPIRKHTPVIKFATMLRRPSNLFGISTENIPFSSANDGTNTDIKRLLASATGVKFERQNERKFEYCKLNDNLLSNQ